MTAAKLALAILMLSFAAWAVTLALVGVAMWRDGERALGLVLAFPALALLVAVVAC